MRVTTVFAFISVPLRLGLALAIASYLKRETLTSRVIARCNVPALRDLDGVDRRCLLLGLLPPIMASPTPCSPALGFGKLQWLQDPQLALWVLIFVNTWKQLGYDIVIYIAGLQAVPQELYDAASVDGGRRFQVFRRVTVPLVMPTTYFLLVISVIEAFQIFTIISVMTHGGPAGATDMLVHMLYRIGFNLFEIGTGSALAVLLFILLIVLSLVKSQIVGRRVHYEA